MNSNNVNYIVAASQPFKKLNIIWVFWFGKMKPKSIIYFEYKLNNMQNENEEPSEFE